MAKNMTTTKILPIYGNSGHPVLLHQTNRIQNYLLKKNLTERLLWKVRSVISQILLPKMIATIRILLLQVVILHQVIAMTQTVDEEVEEDVLIEIKRNDQVDVRTNEDDQENHVIIDEIDGEEVVVAVVVVAAVVAAAAALPPRLWEVSNDMTKRQYQKVIIMTGEKQNLLGVCKSRICRKHRNLSRRSKVNLTITKTRRRRDRCLYNIRVLVEEVAVLMAMPLMEKLFCQEKDRLLLSMYNRI